MLQRIERLKAAPFTEEINTDPFSRMPIPLRSRHREELPNEERPIKGSIRNIRFQSNWLLTANVWVFEPIWGDQ